MDLDKVKAVWYRRSFIKLVMPIFVIKDKSYSSSINLFFENEMKVIKDLILRKLTTVFHIDSEMDNTIDKLFQLEVALKIGLNIPFIYLSSFKKNYKNYYSGEYITKAINASFFTNSKAQTTISGATHILEPIEHKSEIIIPSLIQSKIEKYFELRIFYLLEKFYSIFGGSRCGFLIF